MISAFGVDHGSISKADKQAPDWIAGALPASSVHAYNRSTKNRKKAAATNFAATLGGSAAGTATGAGLVALAVRRGRGSAKAPKFMYRDSLIKNPVTGKKTPITASEKQRYAGIGAGSAAATAIGGTAGAGHLKYVQDKKKEKYGFKGRS